jgi:hypothetical protein
MVLEILKMRLIQTAFKVPICPKVKDTNLSTLFAEILNSKNPYNKYPIINIIHNRDKIYEEIDYTRGSLQVANNHNDFVMYFLWKDLLYNKPITSYDDIVFYKWTTKDKGDVRGLCVMEPMSYFTRSFAKLDESELKFMFNLCEYLRKN